VQLPFTLGAVSLTAGVSVGIAGYPEHAAAKQRVRERNWLFRATLDVAPHHQQVKQAASLARLATLTAQERKVLTCTMAEQANRIIMRFLGPGPWTSRSPSGPPHVEVRHRHGARVGPPDGGNATARLMVTLDVVRAGAAIYRTRPWQK
jgi:hypothetical protein